VAAQVGALDCLAYAHEHGCPWDEELYFAALHKHRLACIKYAHEHGCPWSSAVFEKVVIDGKLAELKYVTQEGCPMDLQKTVQAIKEYATIYVNGRKKMQEKIDYLKTMGIVIDIDIWILTPQVQNYVIGAMNHDNNAFGAGWYEH
jgi:hypothetical protein